ncbi:hypothetical protein B0H67DRAFT_26881 [Lasiosphaeris hirsuta]|uniref:Uncharacterized protein n=1 Tax=Lasiosphaeris hirsuta TaxID=260670 RepID=A0AA40B9T6_9PEZI|nr:hypothetical protein B0H67DRAFT_26881 [Lasiosphaeris hirsuta]
MPPPAFGYGQTRDASPIFPAAGLLLAAAVCIAKRASERAQRPAPVLTRAWGFIPSGAPLQRDLPSYSISTFAFFGTGCTWDVVLFACCHGTPRKVPALAHTFPKAKTAPRVGHGAPTTRGLWSQLRHSRCRQERLLQRSAYLATVSYGERPEGQCPFCPFLWSIGQAGLGNTPFEKHQWGQPALRALTGQGGARGAIRPSGHPSQLHLRLQGNQRIVSTGLANYPPSLPPAEPTGMGLLLFCQARTFQTAARWAPNRLPTITGQCVRVHLLVVRFIQIDSSRPVSENTSRTGGEAPLR